MANEDFDADAATDTQEQERPGEFRTGASVKSVLEGSLLAEKLRRNIWFVLFATLLGILYITNGYSTEKLHREKIALEKEVKDLRFESITKAADLMFIRKQSEVIKRIKAEGLNLEESKEPPVKLYRK